MKLLKTLIMLLTLSCIGRAQAPAPPTGYVQPQAMVGLGPNGFANIVMDLNGNLFTSGAVGRLNAISGYVNPFAPVALDPNGNWQYLNIDSNGNLKVTGSGGAVTSVIGTTNQIGVATGTTTPVISIPTTFIAPGTISAATSIDATKLIGNLPALNGSALTNLPLAGLAGVNGQTGTTYTFVQGDENKLVTFSNALAIAATLPQAGLGGNFASGWYMYVENRGVGTLTITPTTSTIDGNATLALTQGEGTVVVSDGTNYYTMSGTVPSGGYPASNISSGTLNVARVPFASPGAIGGTTAAAGTFTILNATTSVSSGTAPLVCGTATGCFGATEGSTATTPTSGQDACRADSTAHGFLCTLNDGAEFTSAMNLAESAVVQGLTVPPQLSVTSSTTPAITYPALPNGYTEDPHSPYLQNLAIRHLVLIQANGGSSFTGTGDAVNNTGTFSAQSATSSLPLAEGVTIANGSAVGSVGNTVGMIRTGRTNGIRMTCMIYVGTSLTNVRTGCMVGNTASLAGYFSAAQPVHIYAEVIFDQTGAIGGLNDGTPDSTHWQICTGTDGTHQSCASTGVVVATGTKYILELFEDVTNSQWTAWVNGANSTSEATNNPASGTGMEWAFGAWGVGSVTGTLNVSMLQVTSDW